MTDIELDEAELFNQAVSDEPETPVIEEKPIEQQEQPADGQEEHPDGEKPPIPPKPEYRLKEDAEARRRAERDLADERADKAALKQRLEALERANQPAAQKVETPARPDPLLDPDGYAKAVRDDIRQEMLNERREESLQSAAEKYKDEFKEAYQAAQQRVDPALRARMQESRNPGETLIQWHRENKTRAEIGGDLTAYKARLREEALKDPEFRKAAMEAWRSDAQPAQVNGRPRVELPPTLNGASRANAALRSEDNAVSDAELFREIAG